MALKDIVNISLLGFSVQKSILSSNVLLKWLSKKAWNRFCLAVFTLGRRLHVQNHWKQKGVLHCGPSKGPSWLFVVDLLVACSLSPVHLSPTVVWCGFIKTHGWAVAVVGWLLAALVGSLDKYRESPSSTQGPPFSTHTGGGWFSWPHIKNTEAHKHLTVRNLTLKTRLGRAISSLVETFCENMIPILMVQWAFWSKDWKFLKCISQPPLILWVTCLRSPSFLAKKRHTSSNFRT